MILRPTDTELRARALTDLRMGVPIVLDGATQHLVFAAETLTQDRLQAAFDMGTPVMALTHWRAQTLKLAAYDGDIARVEMPHGTTAKWVHAMADPTLDLQFPMKGPFTAVRDDAANPARIAVGLVKSAQLLPAVIMVALQNGADTTDLTHVSPATQHAATLETVAAAPLPLAVSEAGRLHIFRLSDDGEEHYAVEIGTPDRAKPVLARLHSACFTGDILGSLKCDCGPQLRGALAQMGAEQSGVLLYLNQEGRGIGLANKMRAYALQAQGFDTVDANHRLGFEDDERDFKIGADILKKLGFSDIRLLTNNPNKVARLSSNGLNVVERVPLQVGKTDHNLSYLQTKAARSGHFL